MSRVAGWVPGSRAAVHRLERKMAEQNGHDRLATPGNENRADETNPILGFQSRNRKHEESMTYTIFSEEANSGRQAGRPTLLALGCTWDDMLWLSYSQLSMRARGSRVGKWWMLLR